MRTKFDKLFAYLFGLIVFFLALFVVFLTVYLFFYKLFSTGLVGNDMRLAYSYAYFYDYYWPKIPIWYPLVGGGTSLILGYPILTSLIVVIIKRLFELNLAQAMVFLSFTSFILSGIFLYLFCSLRLKNRTVGIIAAASFYLSHIMWGWYVTAGFFAFSASFFFVPLVFLLFDYFLEKLEKKEGLTKRGRLGFLFLVFTFSLGFISHPSIGIIIATGLFFYLIGKLIVVKASFLDKIKISFFSYILPIITSFALISFWLLPFYYFSGFANREGLLTVTPSSIAYYNFDQMFGLKPWDAFDLSGMVAFNRGVSILAGIGIILGLLRNFRKAFPLLFVTLLPLLYITPILGNLILPLKTYLDVRGNVLLTFFVPVLSGFGAYYLPQTVFAPFIYLIKKIKIQSIRYVSLAVVYFIVSILAFFIGWQVISHFPNLPKTGVAYLPNGKPYLPQGALGYSGWGPVLPGINLSLYRKPSEWLSFIKNFKIENKAEHETNYSALPKDLTSFDLSKAPRVFFSPALGQLNQELASVSFASNIESYTYQLSLIHWSWGFSQARIFFGQGSPDEINEWAKWYGLRYAGLFKEKDTVSTFKKAGWQDRGDYKLSSGTMKLFRAPVDFSLISASQKPRVLVIGKYKFRPYEQIFKQAVLGVISYDDAVIIEGKDNVDDYSKEELSKYSLIILHAYQNNSSSESLLRDYIASGGKVFIVAGWQYTSSDWQREQTPDFFPFEKLSWQESPRNGSFKIEDKNIKGDVSKFGKMLYGTGPWGVSTGKVKVNARTLLSYDGVPFIASMKYGNGQIAVSGINIFAHIAVYKNNQEEVKMLNQILFKMLSDKKNKSEEQLTFSRDFPDRVIIHLKHDYSNSTVYFREAYFPYWQAVLVDSEGRKQKLKIERAGVGFMSFFLDKANKGDKIVLEVKENYIGRLGKLLSIATIILLSLFLISPRIFSFILTKRMNNRGLLTKVENKFKKIGEGFSKEDEDY